MNTVRSVVMIMSLLLTVPMAQAGGAVYALQIDGLACPFCTYGIEKKLKAITGVKAIEVDIKNGRVIVTMNQDASLSERQARQAVTEAGFTLRSFRRRDGEKNEPGR